MDFLGKSRYISQIYMPRSRPFTRYPSLGNAALFPKILAEERD